MGTVVAMTYAHIQGVAKVFDTQSQTLKTVAKVLKALAQALKASFFGAILFAEIIRRAAGTTATVRPASVGPQPSSRHTGPRATAHPGSR